MARLLTRTSVVLSLAAVPLFLSATNAFAAGIHHGDDYGYNVGNTVYACDNERDGNGVYVEYWGEGSTHGQVWDGNGSAAGCGSASVPSLWSFQVCEDHSGCSGRVYV
ncbi:hypothetical protein ACFWIB_36580 [Streptomyces sp. NPDC127051]|uniref:hypothetical protein n=1 Tax=Streptomyces sp. NPDC127051 TaxID=3347119 RepID=UPI00365E857E